MDNKGETCLEMEQPPSLEGGGSDGPNPGSTPSDKKADEEIGKKPTQENGTTVPKKKVRLLLNFFRCLQ